MNPQCTHSALTTHFIRSGLLPSVPASTTHQANRRGGKRVEVIDTWTGYRASALQRALRMTNERFAARLGTAVRTVANWNAEPNRVITSELQSALDTLLYQSSDDVKARFALILSVATPVPSQPVVEPAVELRISTDRRVGAALAWLDQAATWAPGTARQALTKALAQTNLPAIQERGFQRQRITQQQIAAGLHVYYSPEAGHHRLYEARVGSRHVRTSILTQPAWLDLGSPLRTAGGFEFAGGDSPIALPANAIATTAAIKRLAEALTANLPVGAGRMYRLTNIHVGNDNEIAGTFGLADFIAYSLTMDLLEAELVDQLASGAAVRYGALPLRDTYLPDVPAVLNLENRLCGGGILALTAIARPSSGLRAPDYLLLVQERSGRVLNAARKLAVIPKAFHEPLSDYREDVRLASTLEREMEEELFGRTDVDSAYSDQRQADPMHPSRLSEPMRWLIDHPEPEYWRMECTGFGLNLGERKF